jgi:hypothetical protein
VDIKKLNPKLEKSSNAKQFQSAQMKPREFTKKAQTEHFSDFQQNVKGPAAHAPETSLAFRSISLCDNILNKK